jgi:hypothetical protein
MTGKQKLFVILTFGLPDLNFVQMHKNGMLTSSTFIASIPLREELNVRIVFLLSNVRSDNPIRNTNRETKVQFSVVPIFRRPKVF